MRRDPGDVRHFLADQRFISGVTAADRQIRIAVCQAEQALGHNEFDREAGVTRIEVFNQLGGH